MKKDEFKTKEKNGNYILEYNDGSGIYIESIASKQTLSNSNERIKFFKKCESIIRKSKRYKAYKLRLLQKGLDMCAVFGNVTNENAKIEMHHGPIFTLWDYVEITVNFFYLNSIPINTFVIADQILKDHFDDIIQVVMVSETVHKMVHNPAVNFKLDLDSAWGDLVSYIEKYSIAFSPTHFSKINSYLNLPKNNNDLELIKTNITKWKTEIVIPNLSPSFEQLRKKLIKKEDE